MIPKLTRNVLPESVKGFLRRLQGRIEATNVGFRRENMPSLLLRFFLDMRKVFGNIYQVLKPGGQAMVVMGDNIMTVDGVCVSIPTTSLIADIGSHAGLKLVETIPITVTTENKVHVKNAIRNNSVLWFRRS
jgi:site-specific DNA-methyltransferase (cytosine-N4-specific)